MADIIPIPDDFEACVQHAVDQGAAVHAFIADAWARGIDHVYLVGCGGSHFGTYPAFDLLDRYTDRFGTTRIASAELSSRNPAALGPRSLMVAASHSGNTPETVAAARYAKESGAMVIGISRQGDNGLSRAADLHLDYPDTITITEPKLVLNELVAVALLDRAGAAQHVEALRSAIPALPTALLAAKREIAAIGGSIADIVANASLTYVIGAGPSFGMAKMMAWCYFMEMQWMHASAINGADFFHGPLEMTLPDTATIVLVAEDATRPLGERVARFVGERSSRAAVLDTATLSLPGVRPEARADISQLALMAAGRRVLDHVSVATAHDTSIRRYMYKVAY